jgi:hypothetical protein
MLKGENASGIAFPQKDDDTLHAALRLIVPSRQSSMRSFPQPNNLRKPDNAHRSTLRIIHCSPNPLAS